MVTFLKRTLLNAGENSIRYSLQYSNTWWGGYLNILIGTLSACSLTTGIRNVALGMSNLRHVTDGDYNTAVGDSAGRLDSTAAGTDARSSSYNTAVGAQAGQYKFTGCYNVSLGYRAGFLTRVTNYTTTNNNSNVFSYYILKYGLFKTKDFIYNLNNIKKIIIEKYNYFKNNKKKINSKSLAMVKNQIYL